MCDEAQSLDCEISREFFEPGIHNSFTASSQASDTGVGGALKEQTQSRHRWMEALEFRIRASKKFS